MDMEGNLLPGMESHVLMVVAVAISVRKPTSMLRSSFGKQSIALDDRFITASSNNQQLNLLA